MSNTTAAASSSSHASGGNGAMQPPMTDKDYCLEALKNLNLEPGVPIVFDKNLMARGDLLNGDQETKINTNIFGLKVQKFDVYQYHLQFTKTLSAGRNAGKTFPLVDMETDNPDKARKMSDYTTVTNRQMHQHLFDAFVAKYPQAFGQDPNQFCYDYASTLYSLSELSCVDTPMDLTVPETQAAVQRPFSVTLRIIKPQDNVFGSRDIIGKMTTNLDDSNAHVIRFLELATSRYAASHPEDHVMYESKTTYLMHPEKYNIDSPPLTGGKYLAAGANKTVACIEGPKKTGATAVILDSKKTPFYHAVNLLQICCDALRVQPGGELNTGHWEMIEKYVKRLECFPTYGTRQEIPITFRTLSHHGADSTYIDVNGTRMSITQYYYEKYQIILKCPRWPLAIAAKRVNGRNVEYPLEVLFVADYQRVGRGNITATDTQTIVKACAVDPTVKNHEIKGCFESFAFNDDQFCRNAGLEVIKNPLECSARVIKAPTIAYAKTPSLNPGEDGKWRLPRSAKYTKAVEVKGWIVVWIHYGRGDRFNLDTYFPFVQMYIQECKNRGIMIDLPALDIQVVQSNRAEVEQVFRNAAIAKNAEFIFFAQTQLETSLHAAIKGFERKYGIVSQCIKTETINNIVQKKRMLSLENVVAKTNMKLGGLNYDVVLDNYPIDPKVLFIGLGMNHPAGGLGGGPGPKGPNATYPNGLTEPNVSVLGVSANDGALANEFIGNFYFQPMYRDEKLTVLDKALEEIMLRFKENRGYAPSRVIFYRSGCSEGAFASVLRYELPILISVIGKHAPYVPISLIVPSKIHAVRFFKTDINAKSRPDDQNVRPGTVLDRHVVSQNFSEFYLNSHLALQGTAKTPKYTILFSTEKNPTLDMFERWTHALCFNFQIVSSPTSLPAPCYIAMRYSERGRQIWNTFPNSNDANSSENSNGHNGGNGHGGNGHNGGNGHGGNGHNGNDSNGHNGNGEDQNPYYALSKLYNFTDRGFLRSKRVNA